MDSQYSSGTNSHNTITKKKMVNNSNLSFLYKAPFLIIRIEFKLAIRIKAVSKSENQVKLPDELNFSNFKERQSKYTFERAILIHIYVQNLNFRNNSNDFYKI